VLTCSLIVLLLALTAVRYLGRNPIGSQTLLTTAHLSTLLFHSALPFGLSLGSSSDTSSAPGSASSTTVSPTAPPPYSPQALEALKVLANLLVLHPAGRNRFHNAGGARVTAIALAGKDARGTDHEGLEEKERERVFLLGRLGFLVTVERKGAVEIMVDQEGIVESLVYVGFICLAWLQCIGLGPAQVQMTRGDDFDSPLTGLIVFDQPRAGPSQLCGPGRGAQARDEHRSVPPQVELVCRGLMGRTLRSVSLHRGLSTSGLASVMSDNMILRGLDAWWTSPSPLRT
jgi:hypothetical protein